MQSTLAFGGQPLMNDAPDIFASRAWSGGAATRRTLCLCCIGMMAGGLFAEVKAEPAAPGAQPRLPAPLADHHLHIQGPEISAALKRLGARDPAIIAGYPPLLLNPRTGADALKLLDEAGATYGILLSEAYMFGSPLMAPDQPDVAALTRAENAYNVAEAKTGRGRLLAFIGVDPISPTALPEIDHWGRHGGASGLKLHLANSFVDFGQPAQMQQLKDAFAAARVHRLPIIIHLRNRFEWGASQANAFIDEVLPTAEGLPVTVAHSVGWGPIDKQQVEALDAFSKAIASGRPGTSKLTFDLAVVSAPPMTGPDDPAHFVGVMRTIGMERFQFGSDWPAKYTPAEEAAYLGQTLALTPAEWRVIMSHRASYLPRG
jgi:predicted TIM-barrel fold metal-dependent hydrolase